MELEKENARLKRLVADISLDNAILPKEHRDDVKEALLKKVISPVMHCQAAEQAQQVLAVSERRVCRVLGQLRSTQRYDKGISEDEEILRTRSIALTSQHGWYSYRRVTAMLSLEGWRVHHERVKRIWLREGLKVPLKQPKRGCLWLNDSSNVHLRPQLPMHVWSHDFVQDHTQNGNPFRILPAPYRRHR
jgi:hypothetical protein